MTNSHSNTTVFDLSDLLGSEGNSLLGSTAISSQLSSSILRYRRKVQFKIDNISRPEFTFFCKYIENILHSITHPADKINSIFHAKHIEMSIEECNLFECQILLHMVEEAEGYLQEYGRIFRVSPLYNDEKQRQICFIKDKVKARKRFLKFFTDT